MKKIKIGDKYKRKQYEYREVCFGIYEIDGKLYLTKKNEEISLIGGGIEKNETFFDCLKREFLEESGCTLKNAKELYTIECYWTTRNNIPMISLVHIFLVDIEKEIISPTEQESELIVMNKEEALDKLELPYQKKAIELYLGK